MLKNIVAIVGRPNIGKSTLFNRLTRSRTSIVADESGVTRDRIYRDMDWDGKQFILVDTGGLVPDTTDFIESRIKLQAEIAISEADVIIYLTDVETGVTAIDEDIANLLKRSKKKIIPVVNKVDNMEREAELSEFYKLGLGDPIGISALSGRNIGQILDDATSDFAPYDENAPEVEDTTTRIAIIGKPNVGKSSLVNCLLDQNKMIVSNIPGTTRESVDSFLRYQKQDVCLIDTAGIRRPKKVKDNIEDYSVLRSKWAIERCDVAILMVESLEGISKQDIEILEEVHAADKGLILAVNKWDLIQDKETNTAKAYEKLLHEQLALLVNVPIKFISVLEKQRLSKLLDLALEVKSGLTLRISTSKLNDYIIPIIQKTPPPSVLSRFIRIKFVSQVAINPPTFAFFTNEPENIKDNYKRFLERKLREEFGFQGIPIVLKFKKKSLDDAPKKH